jgi:hypothetical protein
MALSPAIRDREFTKFRDAGGTETKVAVAIEGDTGLIQGIEYDDIQATFPNNTTEQYSYYLLTVLQATIEVTYTNECKKILLRARRV